MIKEMRVGLIEKGSLFLIRFLVSHRFYNLNSSWVGGYCDNLCYVTLIQK